MHREDRQTRAMRAGGGAIGIACRQGGGRRVKDACHLVEWQRWNGMWHRGRGRERAGRVTRSQHAVKSLVASATRRQRLGLRSNSLPLNAQKKTRANFPRRSRETNLGGRVTVVQEAGGGGWRVVGEREREGGGGGEEGHWRVAPRAVALQERKRNTVTCCVTLDAAAQGARTSCRRRRGS